MGPSSRARENSTERQEAGVDRGLSGSLETFDTALTQVDCGVSLITVRYDDGRKAICARTLVSARVEPQQFRIARGSTDVYTINFC